MESAAAESSAATVAKKDGHDRRFHRDILCCFLCRGFLIDATTITECMHTFCKSCLLQRLESIPSCPTCGVQLQRSRLGEQLRLDHTVQNIVYKCVPGLWHEEQRRRKHFSDTHPLGNTSLASVVPTLVPPLCFSPEDSISLSVDYVPPEDSNKETQQPVKTKLPDVATRRYFRCPAAVTVHSFQRLLSLKFDVRSDFKVEVMYENEKLKSQYRLMDIAYMYGWTQEEPLRLQFRLNQSRPSIVKSQPSSTNTVPVPLPSVPTSSATQSRTTARGSKLPSQPATTPTSKREREKMTPAVDRSVSPSPVLKKSKMVDKRTDNSPVTTKKSPAVSAKPTGRGQWRKTKTSEPKVRGSVYQAVHQMLKKKLPALLSTAPAVAKEPESYQRKKEPAVPLTETTQTAEEVPPTPSWETPSNGVELLVKAAELASQQCPTPPPSSSSESESIHSTPSCATGALEKPSSPNGSLVIVEEDDEDAAEQGERQDPSEERAGSPQCSSETALDLSSKSSRIHPETNGTPTSKAKPTLHSITESLAHRQQQLLQAKQQPPDAMRNLLTLSQTAVMVASARPKSVAQPVNSERAAAQRLLAAMQRTFASFSTPQLQARVPSTTSGARSKTSTLNVVQRPS